MLATDKPIRRKENRKKSAPLDGLTGKVSASKGAKNKDSAKAAPRKRAPRAQQSAARKAFRTAELLGEGLTDTKTRHELRAKRAKDRKDELIARRLPEAMKLLGDAQVAAARKQAIATSDGVEAWKEANKWIVADAGLIDKRIAREQKIENRNRAQAKWLPVDEKRREADRERARMDKRRDAALGDFERAQVKKTDAQRKQLHARVQAAASVLGETGIKLGPMATRDAEYLKMLASQPTLVRQEQRRAQAALDALGPRYSKEAQAVYRVKREADQARRAGKKVDREKLKERVAEVQRQQRNLAQGLTEGGADPNRWDRRLKAAAEKGAGKIKDWPGHAVHDPLDSAINVLETARNAPGNLAQMAVAIPVGLGTAALNPVDTVKAAPKYPGKMVDEAEVALSDPGQYIKDNPVVVIGGAATALKAADNLAGFARGNRTPKRKLDAPRWVQPGTKMTEPQYRPTGLLARKLDVRRKPGGKDDVYVEPSAGRQARRADRHVDQVAQVERAERRIAERDTRAAVEAELRSTGLSRKQARRLGDDLSDALFADAAPGKASAARERLAAVLGEERVAQLVDENKSRLAEQGRRRAERLGVTDKAGNLRVFQSKAHATSHVKRHGTQAGYEARVSEIVDDLMEKFDALEPGGKAPESRRRHERAMQAAADGGMARDDAIAFARERAQAEVEKRGDVEYKSAQSGEYAAPKPTKVEHRSLSDDDARMLASEQVTAANEKLAAAEAKLAAAKGGKKTKKAQARVEVAREELDAARAARDAIPANRHALLPANVAARFTDHAKVGSSPAAGAIGMRGLNAMANRVGLVFSKGMWAGSAVEPWLHVLSQGALSPGNVVRRWRWGNEMRARHGSDWASTLAPGNYVGGVVTDVGTQPLTKELLDKGAQITRPDGTMTTMGAALKRYDNALERVGARGAGRMYNRFVASPAFGLIGGAEHSANKLLMSKNLARNTTGTMLRRDDARRMADELDRPGADIVARRGVQRQAGKYDAFTPQQRQGVRYWAPWMAWVANTGTWPARFAVQRPGTAAALLATGQLVQANNEELMDKYGTPDLEGEGADKELVLPLKDGRVSRVLEYANPASIWSEAAKGGDNLADVLKAQVLPTLSSAGRFATTPGPKPGSDVTEAEHIASVLSKFAGASVPLWNPVVNKTLRVPERLRHRQLGDRYDPWQEALNTFPLTGLLRGEPPSSERAKEVEEANRLGLELWQVRQINRLRGKANRELNVERNKTSKRRKKELQSGLTDEQAKALAKELGR